jgi:diguanylate cyclase (GGDEF)-like protein/PAS domain S-box-containing protein
MYRILNCLGVEHNWRLVALAAAVCFLASLVAVSMFHRARANNERARAIWTGAAGAATGSGIWATHFIAMLAYDPGIAVAYDIGLTALSLLAAAVVTTIGLGVAIYGTHRWSAPIGGGIVGGGVACMHYLGMSALDLPGRVTWAPDLVVASIALGMAFGVAALAVATRHDTFRATIAATLLLTLAIVSHHFTAMGAVLILPDPTHVVDPLSLAPGMLALAIAGIAMAVLGMSLAGALADRHLADRATEAAARFHGLAEAATEALAICDGETIVDVNSSLERLTGRKAAELTGRPVSELFQGANASALRGDPSEILLVTATGEPVACEATARTIPYRDTIRTVVSIRDVRERKRAEARIIHLAHHDPLTDLPNRAAFNERLEMTLENADRTGTAFAVLCIDFDRFKEVNDVFGHLVGDTMLREVANRLQEAAGGNFLARLGGDEFTILVEGVHPTAAEAVAARLQAAVAHDILIDGHELRVGLSIGVAVYPQDGMDVATLLVHADAALYRAKADGRGTIRFFDGDMDKRLRERRALQLDLRQAPARNEIHLHYQPQARIDGSIIGFEVLARWDHPTHGAVPPATFIPLAEESGMIIPLGEWILKEACREAASWARPLQIAVNLSPVQFRHGNLPAVVQTVLLETGLPANRLELEVTESVLIGDFSRAVLILRQLKALGIRIAMDDFGTGYSSLSYLQSFPFDKIKIDGSFVANLDRGSQSAAIIRAVIGLGRGLDLPVMAEGVETREQREFLSSEACDEMQGYLIGRPRPIEDYADIVGAAAEKKRMALVG